MKDQTMRGFLNMVEQSYPDQIIRITEPVRRELDITSSVFELERLGRSPVLIFESVEGFDIPVVPTLLVIACYLLQLSA